MKYLTAKQYASLPRSEKPYLIHKFIPATGSIMLIGPPKEGKSYMALQIAMAVAAGKPFLGRPSIQSKVLYIQIDTPQDTWIERLHDLQANGIELPDNLIIPDPLEVDFKETLDIKKNAEDVLYLKQMVADVDPALIVLDSLRDFYSGDENNSDVASDIYKIFMDIFKGRSMLFVHHTHKLSPPPGQKVQHRISPVDAARGANAMAAKMNGVYLLNGNMLRTDPRFDAKADYHCQMDPVTNLWIFDEEEKITKHEKLVRDLYASKSWATWLEFRRHVKHTLVTVPDHLLTRLEGELSPSSVSSSELM